MNTYKKRKDKRKSRKGGKKKINRKTKKRGGTIYTVENINNNELFKKLLEKLLEKLNSQHAQGSIKTDIDAAKKKVDDAQKKVDDAKEKDDAAKEGVNAAEEGVNAAEEGVNAAEEGVNAANEEVNAADNNLTASKLEVNTANEKVNTADNNLTAADDNLTADNEKVNAANEEVNAADDDAAANEKVNAANEEVNAADDNLTAAEKNLKAANKNLKDAQNKLTTANKNFIHAMAKLTTAQNKLTTAQNKLTTAQNKLTTAQNNLKAAQNNLKAAEDEYDNLLNRVREKDATNEIQKKLFEEALNTAIKVLEQTDTNAGLLNAFYKSFEKDPVAKSKKILDDIEGATDDTLYRFLYFPSESKSFGKKGKVEKKHEFGNVALVTSRPNTSFGTIAKKNMRDAEDFIAQLLQGREGPVKREPVFEEKIKTIDQSPQNATAVKYMKEKQQEITDVLEDFIKQYNTEYKGTEILNINILTDNVKQSSAATTSAAATTTTSAAATSATTASASASPPILVFKVGFKDIKNEELNELIKFKEQINDALKDNDYAMVLKNLTKKIPPFITEKDDLIKKVKDKLELT